jgi:hypothetical protein
MKSLFFQGKNAPALLIFLALIFFASYASAKSSLEVSVQDYTQVRTFGVGQTFQIRGAAVCSGSCYQV